MSDASPRALATETIITFFERSGKDLAVTPETPLFSGRIILDSLETAELSMMLEDKLGRDPWSDGILAQTVGEVLDFYSDPS